MGQNSGNSKSRILWTNAGAPLFVKHFGLKRRFEYHRELMISAYINSINSFLTPPVHGSNHLTCEITYPLLSPITRHDINAEQEYLECLQELHRSVSASWIEFPLYAKEALINNNSITSPILERIGTLLDVSIPSSEYNDVYCEMKGLIYGMEALINKIIAKASELKPTSSMLFSHADFGLHNCVRDEKDKLLIIDLEYSGLDSPVKQLYDCLLSPRCSFSKIMQSALRKYFISIISDTDRANLSTYGGAFAVKWMLIVLNEFIPENWARRVLANSERRWRRQEILRGQLGKARTYAKIAASLIAGLSLVPEISESERAELSKPY